MLHVAMDEHTLRVLEFSRVLEMAASFATTSPGGKKVLGMEPLGRIGDMRARISLVSECVGLISEGHRTGIEHFEDLSPLLQKLRPANAVIEPPELRSFLPLFSSSSYLRDLGRHESCPGLAAIVSQITTHPHICAAIDSSIDKEGTIRDEASPGLHRTRKSIRSCDSRIRKMLGEMLRQKDLIPFLQDLYLAERNRRLVIPVKREYRGSIPGIIHDISNTGETVYVEPFTVQPLGNELESYRAEEKLEEYRVLQGLSDLLRTSLPEIEKDFQIVSEVDALLALARFSQQMRMNPPELNERGYMRIIGGRHPLLWKILRRESHEEQLVPLDAELGDRSSCMVITGSNAGGKTVALKTIGVLSLMALSGMHIPAGQGTTLPFLRKILVDIGDEQSIEQNLSTFSAHISRISEIILRSCPETLVIIDELGTGTDPDQGGALSCAILRRLRQQGTLVVVSTHLGMLKAFVHSEPGMTNSAMEMQEVTVDGFPTFRPTYRLIMGEPGASHTFDIAESLGFDREIIGEARRFIRDGDLQIESLISDIRKKHAEMDKNLMESGKLRQEAERARSQVKQELLQHKARERDILARALKEAEEILRKTKRTAREIMEKLKISPPSDSGMLKKELDEQLEEIVKTRESYAPVTAPDLRELTRGQRVFLKTARAYGTIKDINEKTGRCRVLAEGKEIEVPLSELREPSAEAVNDLSGTTAGNRQSVPFAGYAAPPDEINVIGMRLEPALSIIERYLNDASLAGMSSAKIIHGIGRGILSRGIREHLKNHALVESYRKGDDHEGGDAVTIITL